MNHSHGLVTLIKVITSPKMKTTISPQSHLSPGVHILKQWVIAACNHEMLAKNRRLYFQKIGMRNLSTEESCTFKSEEEILFLAALMSGLLTDLCVH